MTIESTPADQPVAVNERCWVLIGRRQEPVWLAEKRQPSEGQPTRVAFDHAWVIGREEQHADIIGFLHTHPSGSRQPSQRDVDTMQAWTSCLGKSLLCLIESDNQVDAFLFADDDSTGAPLGAAQVFDVDCNKDFPKVDIVVVCNKS